MRYVSTRGEAPTLGFRDAVLAASGELNPKMGGPGVHPKIAAEILAGQSRPGDGWGSYHERDAARRSAYVYVMPTGGWVNATQNAVLTASDAAVLTSVAISGNTVVAGSPTADGVKPQAGAAYVFVQPAGGWANMTQTAKSPEKFKKR